MATPKTPATVQFFIPTESPPPGPSQVNSISRPFGVAPIPDPRFRSPRPAPMEPPTRRRSSPQPGPNQGSSIPSAPPIPVGPLGLRGMSESRFGPQPRSSSWYQPNSNAAPIFTPYVPPQPLVPPQPYIPPHVLESANQPSSERSALNEIHRHDRMLRKLNKQIERVYKKVDRLSAIRR